MRFLADAGISSTIDFLCDWRHDADCVRKLGMQSAADSDILERARRQASVVLTFDLTSVRFLHLDFLIDRASSSFVYQMNDLIRLIRGLV